MGITNNLPVCLAHLLRENCLVNIINIVLHDILSYNPSDTAYLQS